MEHSDTQQEDYHWAVQAIRTKKISQKGFRDLAAPLFSSLISFSDERRRILNMVETLEQSQHAAWNGTIHRFISEADLERAISMYKRFPEQLNILRANQEAVLEELRVFGSFQSYRNTLLTTGVTGVNSRLLISLSSRHLLCRDHLVI